MWSNLRWGWRSACAMPQVPLQFLFPLQGAASCWIGMHITRNKAWNVAGEICGCKGPVYENYPNTLKSSIAIQCLIFRFLRNLPSATNVTRRYLDMSILVSHANFSLMEHLRMRYGTGSSVWMSCGRQVKGTEGMSPPLRGTLTDAPTVREWMKRWVATGPFCTLDPIFFF